MISKINNFVQRDVWRIRAKELSGSKSRLLKYFRVFVLALRGFIDDKCHLRASALTFFSLLSIVPIFAMVFGIAKGFGLEKLLQEQLIGNAGLQAQREVLTYVVNFANTLLENTKGGVIAGIGVVILFWTVLGVLGNIERSFNAIWGVTRERSFGRKLSDYLALMMICPLLLILSSGTTVFIASQIALVTEKISLLGFAAPVISLILHVLPYGVIWTLFTFIYIFMPNTSVQFKSGLFGGIIAGTIYQLVQFVYITFQIGVAKYGAIYGSFAALPLFLVWLQLSWIVVLLGAEIAFAHQNVDTYEFEPDCRHVSRHFKNLVSLLIAHRCVKHFCQGNSPEEAAKIADSLALPIRLVREALRELVEAGVLSEVRIANGKEGAYQPGRDVNRLTVKNVIESLDQRGTDSIPLAETEELGKLAGHLKSLSEALEKTPSNVALKDI